MSSEVKTYSLAEIKAHNTNKSSWIVIHNNIYDVTEFLNEVGSSQKLQGDVDILPLLMVAGRAT